MAKNTNAPRELSMSEKIDAAIQNIVTRGTSLRNDCHTTLVMIMDHYIGLGNGDTTKIKPFLDAVKGSLGSSLSQAAMNWIAISMPTLMFDDRPGSKTRGTFVHIKGSKERVYAELKDVTCVSTMPGTNDKRKFSGAPRDLPFFELERIQTQKPFNLTAAIIALVKRADAAKEANEKDDAENVINDDALEVLHSLANKLAPSQVTAPTAQQVGANRTASTEGKPVAIEELRAETPVKAGRKPKADNTQKAVAA